MSNAEVTRYHHLSGLDYRSYNEEQEFQLLSTLMRREAPVYTRTY